DRRGGRGAILAAAVGLVALSLVLYPRIGQELIPVGDSGQFTMLVRAPTGTRIERTEEIVAAVEDDLRRVIAPGDLAKIISNIGVLYDWPAAYTPNAGPGDAFVAVQLTEGRRQTVRDVVAVLRRRLPERFPGVEFSF